MNRLNRTYPNSAQIQASTASSSTDVPMPSQQHGEQLPLAVVKAMPKLPPLAVVKAMPQHPPPKKAKPPPPLPPDSPTPKAKRAPPSPPLDPQHALDILDLRHGEALLWEQFSELLEATHHQLGPVETARYRETARSAIERNERTLQAAKEDYHKACQYDMEAIARRHNIGPDGRGPPIE